MNEQFWHDRWQTNQTAFHQQETNPLLAAHLDGLALPAGAHVFVPLCGKSLDMVWLRRRGLRVTGAELSPLAVQQFFAQLQVEPVVTAAGPLQRYEAQGNPLFGGITLFQGNLFDLTPELLGPVDLVYDRAAVVALPEPMRTLYAPHLLRLTASAPQLVLTFEYDQSIMEGPPFSVTESELRRLYPSAALHLLERRAVAGGLKGVCPATEAAWRLQP